MNIQCQWRHPLLLFSLEVVIDRYRNWRQGTFFLWWKEVGVSVGLVVGKEKKKPGEKTRPVMSWQVNCVPDKWPSEKRVFSYEGKEERRMLLSHVSCLCVPMSSLFSLINYVTWEPERQNRLRVCLLVVSFSLSFPTSLFQNWPNYPEAFDGDKKKWPSQLDETGSDLSVPFLWRLVDSFLSLLPLWREKKMHSMVRRGRS